MTIPTIGVVILTLNAERHMPHCVLPWLRSPLKPHVLVVDSSSNDGTADIARTLGADTLVILRHEFNHGTTREKARQHLGTDIVVMVTHDAYAVDAQVLGKLIQPIIEGQAAAAYARQIPHDGADIFEAFPRAFNYPATSHIRSLEDLDKYGVYTFFCSNSCAAYSNKALDAIGGFPEVLFGEDTIAAARLLRQKHRIAYVAEAVVKHSHSYTLSQEFRRHFDIGLIRKEYRDLLFCQDSDHKRGRQYTRQLLQRLIKEQPSSLPYAILQTCVKWLGYQAGYRSQRAPLWLKKKAE